MKALAAHLTHLTHLVLAGLGALLPAPSQACGACVEDKVAAVYEHSVQQRAAADGHLLVFCDVIGPFHAARLKAAARGLAGIQPHSVRLSERPAVLAFAVEPRLLSPQAAVDAMQRRLGQGTRLRIVHQLAPAPHQRATLAR